jgi:hypothetical protein
VKKFLVDVAVSGLGDVWIFDDRVAKDLFVEAFLRRDNE